MGTLSPHSHGRGGFLTTPPSSEEGSGSISWWGRFAALRGCSLISPPLYFFLTNRDIAFYLLNRPIFVEPFWASQINLWSPTSSSGLCHHVFGNFGKNQHILFRAIDKSNYISSLFGPFFVLVTPRNTPPWSLCPAFKGFSQKPRQHPAPSSSSPSGWTSLTSCGPTGAPKYFIFVHIVYSFHFFYSSHILQVHKFSYR